VLFRSLGTAQEATYTAQSLEPVQARLTKRYFVPVHTGAQGEPARFKAVEQLRSLVLFKRLNLAKPPFPMHGPLDVVFCRNVMIYFELQERAGLIGEIERLLAPGGLLFVGHAETLNGIGTSLTRVAPSVYRKPLESLCPVADS
jgi:chemotaxis protein methyltransferase CheR